MADIKQRKFSFGWVIISMTIFIAVELFLGGLVGPFLKDRYMSYALEFTLRGLINLVSFFIGGIIVGLISPGIRMMEPGVGAFLSIVLMMMITFFVPYSFFVFGLNKLIVAGPIACIIAMLGAAVGESLFASKA